MLLVGVQNENKSTDQKWQPSVQSNIFLQFTNLDHSKYYPKTANIHAQSLQQHSPKQGQHRMQSKSALFTANSPTH